MAETGNSWNRLYTVDNYIFHGNDAYTNTMWKKKYAGVNNLKKELLKW